MFHAWLRWTGAEGDRPTGLSDEAGGARKAMAVGLRFEKPGEVHIY